MEEVAGREISIILALTYGANSLSESNQQPGVGTLQCICFLAKEVKEHSLLVELPYENVLKVCVDGGKKEGTKTAVWNPGILEVRSLPRINQCTGENYLPHLLVK